MVYLPCIISERITRECIPARKIKGKNLKIEQKLPKELSS